ncbi:uncharacterized protein [Panulirus ornatus]|uniref:uncharacterized protein n=1 Tax=Panulirus ornatus TaxID=150431 RepID=UPI003A8763B6
MAVKLMCLMMACLLATTTLARPEKPQPSTAYGPPEQSYGPPEQSYGPPEDSYEAPELSYGPPKPVYRAPAPSYKAPEPDSYEKGMPFVFSYDVQDQYSGNSFAHNADSDGTVVSGEYRVDLPDGRTQIVTYKADIYSGYVAEVRYEGEAQYPEQEPYRPSPTPSYQPPEQSYGPPPSRYGPPEE